MTAVSVISSVNASAGNEAAARIRRTRPGKARSHSWRADAFERASRVRRRATKPLGHERRPHPANDGDGRWGLVSKRRQGCHHRRTNRLHIGENERPQDRVIGLASDHHDSSGGAHESGRPHDHRHHGVGGSHSGSEQLTIDIEEHDSVSTTDAMQRRLSPDHDVGVVRTGPTHLLSPRFADGIARIAGHIALLAQSSGGGRRPHRRTGDLDHWALRQCFKILSQAGRSGTQLTHPSTPTCSTHNRPLVRAAAAHQHRSLSGKRQCRPAPLAFGQRRAGAAIEQPRSTGAVENAHHPSPLAQMFRQPGGDDGHPSRFLVCPVDELDDRPTRPLGPSVGRQNSARRCRQRMRAGDGADQQACGSDPSSPFNHHLAGMPGGRPFVLVRLVVFVEYYHRSEPRRRGPCGGPRPDDDRSWLGGARPLVGQEGNGGAEPTEPPGQIAGRGNVRGEDEQAPPGGDARRLDKYGKRIGQRRQPHNGDHRLIERSLELSDDETRERGLRSDREQVRIDPAKRGHGAHRGIRRGNL